MLVAIDKISTGWQGRRAVEIRFFSFSRVLALTGKLQSGSRLCPIEPRWGRVPGLRSTRFPGHMHARITCTDFFTPTNFLIYSI
jgi:hypothetical protein